MARFSLKPLGGWWFQVTFSMIHWRCGSSIHIHTAWKWDMLKKMQKSMCLRLGHKIPHYFLNTQYNLLWRLFQTSLTSQAAVLFAYPRRHTMKAGNLSFGRIFRFWKQGSVSQMEHGRSFSRGCKCWVKLGFGSKNQFNSDSLIPLSKCLITIFNV